MKYIIGTDDAVTAKHLIALAEGHAKPGEWIHAVDTLKLFVAEAGEAFEMAGTDADFRYLAIQPSNQALRDNLIDFIYTLRSAAGRVATAIDFNG